MSHNQIDLEQMAVELLQSRKYRSVQIPMETVRDLLQNELARQRSPKEAIKEVRQKLHNIVAPYLGDPDYAAAASRLKTAFSESGDKAVESVCLDILAAHASTRERIPVLKSFYQQIFQLTGKPDVLLDLACGLNPFSFRWMGLPVSTHYYAYDLHGPRVELINQYFGLEGLQPLASAKDILVSPPDIEAPVAFFFKEAHRFEQRQHGCNRAFWQTLKVRYLLVSLPGSNLTGQHSLVERQRRLVHGTLEGLPWTVREIFIENEMIFCVDKYGEK